MERKKVFAVAAAVTGILLGGAVAYGMNIDEHQARNYCGEVEKSMEENISEGFVNCFPPQGYDLNLREEVEESSNVECVCRKKSNGILQTINLARSK